MSKTRDDIRAELMISLLNQNLNTLINSLADANAKIEELTAKLAALENKQP